MKKEINMYRTLTIAAVAALLAGPALAGATCAKGPASQYKPASALKAKLAAEGLKVHRIKEENGCYEVYAISAKGEKINTAFNAVTFEQVGNAEAGENN